MDGDAELRWRAERQHAVLAWFEARQLLSRKQLISRVRAGELDRPTSRVVRLVGAPRTMEQAVMIAVLDAGAGAAASVDCASRLWRLPGSFPGVDIGRLRGTRGCESNIGTVHAPRTLAEHHVTVVRGIPVTTLARTLFDQAARLHPERFERLLDGVIVRSPSTLASLHDVLDEIGKKGRPGTALVRVLLKDRPVGFRPFESNLERRFAELLANAGEPPLTRQVDVGGHEWLGRVDFSDLSIGLLVEVDSDLHHTSPTDRAADAARDEAMLAAGYRMVLRISEDQIWRRPYDALAAIRDARRRLRREAA